MAIVNEFVAGVKASSVPTIINVGWIIFDNSSNELVLTQSIAAAIASALFQEILILQELVHNSGSLGLS